MSRLFSLLQYWYQLSRFQRNLIIIIGAGLCLVLLLLLPNSSGQSTVVLDSDDYAKDLPNHIQITPLKEHVADYLATNEGRKRKSIEDLIAQNNNNNAVGNILDEPKTKTDEYDNVANNVIDNVQNAREAPSSDQRKDFKGPTNDRQRAVVAATRHAWSNYKEFAWGHDNLKPISMSSHDWFGLGLTIVDSLDTLYIMDMQEEFDDARSWIEQYLRLDVNRDINLFEVSIRVLGGLLATYHLTGDRMFLTKAVSKNGLLFSSEKKLQFDLFLLFPQTELGNRLMPAFNSPSGIPYSDVNLAQMVAHSPKWSPDSSTSEVTTLQLEFRDLSYCTKDKTYAEAANRINEIVHGLEKKSGLVPIFINANTGQFRNFATISLGARGDSYYEYLLKQWLQTGKKENDL